MKEWRDWFYFSSSERNALSVLTLLIIGIWIALWMTEPKEKDIKENPKVEVSVSKDTIRNKPVIIADRVPNQQESKVVSKPKEARAFHKPFKKSVFKKYVSNKFPQGTIVELNGADSLLLQKVPGIGPTFSRRIVKYRELLGGFYSVSQLAEVYGINEERYMALAPWFIADTTLIRPILVNYADFRTLIRHPYLNKQQTVTILNMIKRKGHLQSWDDLRLLEEFTPADRERLHYYLSFE